MKKKKIFAIGCAFFIFLMCGFSALAEDMPEAEGRIWVWDQAELLTAEEVEALNETCQEIAEKHEVGVSIVTVEDFGGGDMKEWQRRLYEEYEFGAGDSDSGVMLAVSMSERDWGMVAFGDAQSVFTTYCRERIAGAFLDDLSEGNYYDSFSTYLELCDEFMTAAEEGNPYSEEEPYKEGMPIPVIIGAAFLISLLVSLLIVMSWKKSMNTRVQQNAAAMYFEEESFALTKNTDMFLYHTVSRRAKPKDNGSSHSGSMHSDHSGTSGKF